MRIFASRGANRTALAAMLALGAAGLGGTFEMPSSQAAGDFAVAPGDRRFGYSDFADNETGVAASLPFGILAPAQKSGLGMSWASQDHRLKIAILNFGNKKTLLAIHQAIRNRPGRTILKEVLNSTSFEVQGRDQDGSVFFVKAELSNGSVRGVSITCEKGAGTELLSVAKTVIQSFRVIPALTKIPDNSHREETIPAKAAPDCEDVQELSQIASGVHLVLDAPAQIHAGESLRFGWEAPRRFPAGALVYAILAISGEARIEAGWEEQRSEGSVSDNGASSELDAGKLPGFIVLRPASPGPRGINFGAGKTRVFVPLYQDGSHLRGSFAVQLYEAGTVTLNAALIAKTACSESILSAGEERLVGVAPAPAEIVVQDPYDVAVPKSAILSNDGRYLLQVFEGYYRVFDVASGAKLVDRSGSDPNFSPTGRFIAANTGAGEAYEIVDLLNREPVTTVSGLLIAWAEEDAYVIAASAESWAQLTVRPTLISVPAAAGGETEAPDAEEDSLSISEQSPTKNTPSWEAFGIRIDVDAGIAAFSNVTFLKDKDSSNQAHVYELASGRRTSSQPLERGWHARTPLRFSHIYNFDGNKTYNREWAREQAKSKVLKELRRLKAAPKVLDQKGLADLLKASQARSLTADWRALRTRGEPFADETDVSPFASELRRFGIQLARETSRQEYLPPYSAVRASVEADELISLRENPRVQEFANKMKQMLLREVPVSAGLLKEGMLSDKSIDLARHAEGLWRWDIQGQPLWLLEGADNQGSGGFAQINSWILKGEPPAGKVENFRDNAPEGAHITNVGDNTIRLKARLFLDRYLLTGMVSSRIIGITDLRGERQDILIKNIPQAGLLADIRLTSDARHAIQMNSDGEFFFHEAATQKMTLAGRYVEGEIIFYTPEAYYWSSYEGAHFVQLRFPGLQQLASFRQYASMLNRPDIVRAKLKESPPPVPQPELTPPPSLDIVTAANAGQDYQLRIHARSSAALDRLRLYYDGQLVKEEPLSGQEFEGLVSVPRSPHARWLTALAFDRKGVVSTARALRLTPEGRRTNVLYAVLAGIDKYSSPQINLTYAKSDAARLAAAINSRREIYYANQQVEVLAGQGATAQSIIEALDRAARLATPQDTILFFFAGHGVQGGDGRYYLATSDLRLEDIEHSALPWAQIAESLGRSKARAVVILDACHAGLSGLEGLATNDDAVNGLLSGTRAPVLVLAASKGRQESFEGSAWQGGVFTYALSKLLSGKDGPQGPNRQAIDISDLYRKLRDILAVETKGRQTPWLARQDLIGDFALF